MYLYTIKQMMALEKASDEGGHSYDAMMEQAGRAVAEAIVISFEQVTEAHKRVVVLVGPGNNGGDGLVTARELSKQGYSVVAYLWRRQENERLISEARHYGVAILWADKDNNQRLVTALSQAGVIIDALFGTGLSRPITGTPAQILTTLHRVRQSYHALRVQKQNKLNWASRLHDPQSDSTGSLLVAVDIPSGVNGDSGHVDEVTVAADLTVTFAGAKVGMLTPAATELLGQLVIADIGIPSHIVEQMESEARLLTPALAATLLPARPKSGHKGTFGTTLIVGGSLNYVGAPALSALAAGRSGAGLVTLGVPTAIQPILAASGALMSATWLLLPHDMGVLREEAVKVLNEKLDQADSLVLGPGLGGEKTSQRFVWSLLGLQTSQKANKLLGFAPVGQHESSDKERPALPPTVIDADGLNALAAWEGNWWQEVEASLVLTPHPGEMGRLLNKDTKEIQQARLSTAREAANRFSQVVILKGAYTVIAAPDGRTSMAPFANHALAKAGSGDVLAGIIGALLGQGMEPYEAACLGVMAHGLAGELVRDKIGAQGTLASDLIEQLPAVWEALAAT
jgi:NAD(P)H-hydrate epimerase